MLPDRSLLIGQKLLEIAKVEKHKCDIFGDFQTLCTILLPVFLYLTYFSFLATKVEKRRWISVKPTNAFPES